MGTGYIHMSTTKESVLHDQWHIYSLSILLHHIQINQDRTARLHEDRLMRTKIQLQYFSIVINQCRAMLRQIWTCREYLFTCVGLEGYIQFSSNNIHRFLILVRIWNHKQDGNLQCIQIQSSDRTIREYYGSVLRNKIGTAHAYLMRQHSLCIYCKSSAVPIQKYQFSQANHI